MSTYQLTSKNFNVIQGKKNILTINLTGMVLVFFKMDNCEGCKAFEPIFYQLANEDKRINYAIINISTYRQIAQMAINTSTPIRKVPSLILFHTSRPKARYNGTKSIVAIKSFLNKVLTQIPNTPQTHFVQQPPQQQGMYGSGGYSHPQITQPQQSGFNPQETQNNQPKVYRPEGLNMPNNIGGIVKNTGQSQYAYLNDVEEDDEEKLELPSNVTPHNVPWLTGYKKMGTLD